MNDAPLSVRDAVAALATDERVPVVLQVLRTALYTQPPGYEALVRGVVDAHPDNEAVASRPEGLRPDRA